jgi:glycosyltransferase involved in cell wall biosynthesis
VSVCIRAYAGGDALQEAIESALAQTISDLEVVVSDDSGRHAPVAASFGDARVRYSQNPGPRGPVANLRRVFSLARGRFLALLDEDDLWLPDFLEAVLEPFASHPDRLGLAFSDIWLEAAGRRVRWPTTVRPGRHDGFLAAVLHGAPLLPSATLIRREVWEQGEREHPLDERAVADQTMWIRAALAGWAFHRVDRPLVVYRQHPGQISWRDPALSARSVATYERFRFDDPECERLRRARLAEARLLLAGVRLRQRRIREGLHGISGAWRDGGRAILRVRGWLALTGARALFMRWSTRHPALLVRGAPLWRRVRPPVARGGHAALVRR